jgi:hypothetical protein
MTSWDGGLRVEENAILGVQPINFWNANQPLEWDGKNQLTWKSVTTGGLAGVIISLDKPDIGTLSVDTIQKSISCQISSLGLEPILWDCGGLRKEISIFRLPDQPPSSEFKLQLPLTELHRGDNPIYIRMTQEDGHMAWSSPIYVCLP